MLFIAREHGASPWLDLAEDRLRLDRLSRNVAASTFFPWTDHPTGQARGTPDRPIPRETRKSPRRRPPLRYGPRATPSHIRRKGGDGTPTVGCVADRPRPADRHRGRDGRGLENSKEK